jgi:hypothetical protein
MAWVQLGEAAIGALPAPRDPTAIANINYNAAAARLANGPLGVGEEHLDGQARTDVIRLINAGLVRRLFLECDDVHQPELQAALSRDPNAQDYVSTIAAVVTRRQPMYDTPVPLGDVARAAMGRPNPIPMHFVDKDVRNRGNWKRITERDENAADKFRTITQPTGTAGCLLLFGAHHFRGAQSVYGTSGRCLGQNLDLEYVDYGPQ